MDHSTYTQCVVPEIVFGVACALVFLEGGPLKPDAESVMEHAYGPSATQEKVQTLCSQFSEVISLCEEISDFKEMYCMHLLNADVRDHFNTLATKEDKLHFVGVVMPRDLAQRLKSGSW